MSADRTEEEIGFQIGYERASYGVCRQDLDAMGERAVKNDLNSGKYGHAGLAPFDFVSAWLADAEFARTEETEAKRSFREEESLATAKATSRAASNASDSARMAARWAMWAAIIAITAIVISNESKIVALVISWLP